MEISVSMFVLEICVTHDDNVNESTAIAHNTQIAVVMLCIALSILTFVISSLKFRNVIPLISSSHR